MTCYQSAVMAYQATINHRLRNRDPPSPYEAVAELLRIHVGRKMLYIDGLWKVSRS